MSEFKSKDPRSFFVSALIPCPSTRYNSLQAQHWLSILESRISEISNSGSSSTMIGGGGGCTRSGIGFGVAVPTLRCGKTGCTVRRLSGSRKSDRIGARECKDFVRTKEFIG